MLTGRNQMPSVEVEVEVYCNSCGTGLCNQSYGRTNKRGAGAIYVDTCSICADRAYDSGYDRGYNEGFDKGEEINA
jgi:hypothetical protein